MALSNDVKKLVRCKHRNYLYKIQGSFSENPKLFWSYHKAVLHHRSGVESVITYNGQTAKTPGEKADLFNRYFCSVFTTSNTVPSMPSRPKTSVTEISDIELSVEEVSNCLSSLDTSKATGNPHAFSKNVGKKSHQVFVLYLITLCVLGVFPRNGKIQTSHLCIRKI
jgi:hypothetical protein